MLTVSFAPTSPCASTPCANKIRRSKMLPRTNSKARRSPPSGNPLPAPRFASKVSAANTTTPAVLPASTSGSNPPAPTLGTPRVLITPRIKSGCCKLLNLRQIDWRSTRSRAARPRSSKVILWMSPCATPPASLCVRSGLTVFPSTTTSVALGINKPGRSIPIQLQLSRASDRFQSS